MRFRNDKPLIAILTNRNNGEREDEYLGKSLSRDFRVQVIDMQHSGDIDQKFDLILIRNVWPTAGWRNTFAHLYRHWVAQGIPALNTPDGRGDFRGKSYLCNLWKEGYSAIRTTRDVGEAMCFEGKFLFAKPEFGGSGVGCEKIERSRAFGAAATGKLLQPFISIAYEISLYYVDRKLQYALRCEGAFSRWDLKPYNPTTDEVEVGNSFVGWNTLTLGIQRIDLCRSHGGEILLMEIEDFCPCRVLRAPVHH